MRHYRLNYSSINLENLNDPPSLVTRSLLSHYYEINSSFFKGSLTSLLSQLESRLDVVLVRLLFAPSLKASRQLISHHKILINGQINLHPFYLLTPGDLLQSLLPLSFPFEQIPSSILGLPSHLIVNYLLPAAIFCHSPCLEELPFPFSLTSPFSLLKHSKLN